MKEKKRDHKIVNYLAQLMLKLISAVIIYSIIPIFYPLFSRIIA